MARNYGAGVSRYLDPQGTNYELVIAQENKRVLDSEENLHQDIANLDREKWAKQICPSGFLTGDVEQPSLTDYAFRGEADRFYLVNKPIVQVNGWVFPLEYTDTITPEENGITLPASVTGNGATPCDFVFLEVWRALITPDPSTDNKPSATQIYPNGNILAPAATWLTEDLIDPTYAQESTLRVQIQYRIRSVRLSNATSRLGFDNANVLAQGPLGAPSIYSYSTATNDHGLWRAGTGTPGDTSTVDGYIYAIPIALVFRRNLSAFNYLLNGNGGSLISSGTSTRPDGYFADAIELCDVMDLRHFVKPQGFNFAQVLQRNVSLLLDQSLRAQVTDTGNTGWTAGGNNIGNRYLKADDLIPSFPVTDPSSGNTFGSADGYRQVFSDRPHIQEVVISYAASPGGWSQGNSLPFDITALSPLGAPISDEMPLGTFIADIVELRLDDTDGSNGYLSIPIDGVQGLGTQSVIVTLGEVPVLGSMELIYAVFEIAYPSGAGLTSHVTEEMANFDFYAHNPSAYNAAIGSVFANTDAGRAALRNYIFTDYDADHREVSLYHTTDSPVTLNVRAADATNIYLPEYIHEGLAGIVSVTDSALTTHTVSSVVGRRIILDNLDPLPTADDLVEVVYYPQRALPINGASQTLYYRTAALQALPFNELPDSLAVDTLYCPETAFCVTGSSGSMVDSYPYGATSQQIPVSITQLNYEGEHSLNAPGETSLSDFDADVGMVQVIVHTPLVASAPLVLQNRAQVSTENDEFIDHYLAIDGNYTPGIFTSPLSATVPHKTFYPILVRPTEDYPVFRAGTLLMAIFSSYQEASPENRIALNSGGQPGACIGVYLVKGRLLT